MLQQEEIKTREEKDNIHRLTLLVPTVVCGAGVALQSCWPKQHACI